VNPPTSRRRNRFKIAVMRAARSDRDSAGTDTMRRSYIRVIIVWLLVLAGLFAFQEYFS
jgi:hypothetical protein